jgi:hypothetical protein
MPIKFRRIPPEKAFSDPINEHLKRVLSLSKEKTDYAERKLKAACHAAELTKQNTPVPEKIASTSASMKSSDDKDNLVQSFVTSGVTQASKEAKKNIHEYLLELDKLRKENQLVYGKKRPEEPNLSLGLGLADDQTKTQDTLYKRTLFSTYAYTYYGEQYAMRRGAVEFGLTYDNKVFIVPLSEGLSANNLYRMAQGTLLKAIGCIQTSQQVEIENTENPGITDQREREGQVKYISVYSPFFAVETDNIAVSLFALQQLGMDLSQTQVVIPNDKASFINHLKADCSINIHGEIQSAAYYLNEDRFPGAKKLAETQLTLQDKLTELCHSIDDEVLAKRNKKIIENIEGEKVLLKKNLIQFLLQVEKFKENSDKKDTTSAQTSSKEEPTSSQNIEQRDNIMSKSHVNIEESTNSINESYYSMNASIQLFKENNIDLTFLSHEINVLLAYILQNGLKPEEKSQCEKWCIGQETIPSRLLDMENISSHIKFYEQDPIKTCIALLKDYSKGDGWLGVMRRFFSGAWNRNYKDPVNKILSAHNKNELPDNINICRIYEELKESGLMFNYDADSKSSLRKILLFCAKLNDEEKALFELINSSFMPFPPYQSSGSADNDSPLPSPDETGEHCKSNASRRAHDRRALTGEAGNASRRKVIVEATARSLEWASAWRTQDESGPTFSRVIRTNFGDRMAKIFRENSDSLVYPIATLMSEDLRRQ